MKQTRPFCLASASPRRKELLAQFGLEFEVHAANVDESLLPGETPGEYVRRLAGLKAEYAHRRFADHLILAGDTVVVIDGEILGKPRDTREAAHMIGLLLGRTHRVISTYTLLDGATGERRCGSPETLVTFRTMPREWVEWYAALPEAADKAGAYAIQGVGGAIVERIEGTFATGVGFPMEAIISDLLDRGWVVL